MKLEAQIEPLITVSSKSKVKELSQVVWCHQEEPLALVACEFSENKKKKRTGYVMVTFGAIYIFKSKILKADILYYKLHLLDIRTALVTPTTIVLGLTSTSITLKVKNAPGLAYVMKAVLFQCTWGLTDVLLTKFVVDQGAELQNVRITERPKDAFKKRCIFMCHFYDKQGDTLDQIDYFDKFDKEGGGTLMVGRHFHPGSFAPGIGHAIGWETSLKTVCFVGFKPLRFTHLFQALMSNAKTIAKVAFSRYVNGKTAEFAMNTIQSTSVREFWFMECDHEICRSFLAAAKQYRCGIDELCFVQCQLEENHLQSILNSIGKIHCCKTLKKLSFVNISCANFPFDQLTQCLASLPNLETFTASELKCDAAALLTAICQPQVKVNIVNIHNMVFRSSVRRATMGGQLAMLSLNKCAFNGEGLKDLFGWLAKHEGNAVMFQAQHLKIKPDDLKFLQTLNFERVKPSLCEFDWTGNPIPRQYAKYFFAFLAAQKQLRILVLDNLPSMESMEFDVNDFFKMLFNYISKVPLPGLDISGAFNPEAFAKFIEQMSGAKWMRRLCVKCENGGDVVCQAITKTVKELPVICEVGFSGQKPASKAVFFDMWSAVASHKSIHANDFPTSDIANFGWKTFTKEHSEILNKVRGRPPPSTMLKRADFTTSELRKVSLTTSQFSKSTDIFLQTSQMQWIDTGIDNEVRELKTRHSQFGVDEEADSPLVPQPPSLPEPDPEMKPTSIDDIVPVSTEEAPRPVRSSVALRGIPPLRERKKPIRPAPIPVAEARRGSVTIIIPPVTHRRTSSFTDREVPRRESSAYDSDTGI